MVFKAWTNAEDVKCWWGPQDFTTPFCRIDFRPGGIFHYCKQSPESCEFWGKGIYHKIVVPEQIVYTDFFSDEKGNLVSPVYYGMSLTWPIETLMSVTFTEDVHGTRVVLQSSGIPVGMERDLTATAWRESLQRLDEYLLGQS